MKKIIVLMVFAAFTAACHHNGGNGERPGCALYVSPNGNDAAVGMRSAPFATIQRARDEIRRLKQTTGLPDGATVYIAGGIFRQEQSLHFTKEDSGTVEAPIVYQAVTGEEVLLTGGVRITADALKPLSDPEQKARIIDPAAAEKIREADLRALGVTDVGQLSRRGYHRAGELTKTPPAELFIDGKPQTLARWPNVGESVCMGEILDPGPISFDPARLTRFVFRKIGNEVLAEQMEAALGRDVMDELLRDIPGSAGRNLADFIPFASNLGSYSPDLHKRGGTFRFAYDRPLKWADSDDIWIAGIFGFSWEYSYNQVEAIHKAERTVTLRYGEMGGLNKNWFADFHHYENIFEEIDQPGEYYIDRQRMMLYVYLPETISKECEIVLSTLDQPLLQTEGASHLEFRGLQFVGGRKDGVVISGGREVVIEDSIIRSVAGDGAVVRRSYESGLRHCEISHVGAKGVSLGGGDWPSLTSGGNFVENCVIHDFAYREKAYNPGVAFEGKSVGNRATGNQIYNSPHGGIILKGNNHLIQGNQMHTLCLEFLDFGAIYANAGLDPMDRGTRIIGNYIHDIRPDAEHGIIGIYLDVAVWSTDVRNNIISNVGGRGMTLKGHYLVAENNFLHNVPTACWGSLLDRLSTESWKQTFTKYPPGEVPHYDKYPELLHFWDDIEKYGRASGSLNRFANNFIFDPNGILSTPNGVDGRASDYAMESTGGLTVLPRAENNLVWTSDPGFADWKAGNFRYTGSDRDLQKRLGFVNELFDENGRFIPSSNAGVRR
jgi:hypothetical protein